MARPRKPQTPFHRFNSSPEVIRLVVMMYVKFPLSLRNVEDLLAERGIDICHETVRFWWNRFGPMFAAEVRRRRVGHMRAFTHWRWHLDEVYVKINGQMHYLWRAVDHKAAMKEIGNANRQEIGRWANNRTENIRAGLRHPAERRARHRGWRLGRGPRPGHVEDGHPIVPNAWGSAFEPISGHEPEQPRGRTAARYRARREGGPDKVVDC